VGEIRSDSESSDMTMVIIVIEIKSVGMMLKKKHTVDGQNPAP